MNAQETTILMKSIVGKYPNFARGKSALQRREMISEWATALEDMPLGAALKGISTNPSVYPPSSPEEVRERVKPFYERPDKMVLSWLRTCEEENLLPVEVIDRIRKGKWAEIEKAG